MAGQNVAFADRTCAPLVSGDALDGTYEVTGTVPHFAQFGTWSVNVDVDDQVNNSKDWTPSILTGAGFDSHFDNQAAGP